jgi:hypothetical protein
MLTWSLANEKGWYEQLDPEPPFQGNLFHPFHSFEQWDTADTLYRQKANEAFQKEQLDRDYLAGKDTFSSVKKLQDAYDALPNDIPFRQVTIEPVWPPDLSPEQIANLPASLKEPQVFAARNIIEVAKYLAEDEDLVHGSRYQARTLINKYGQRVVKEACDGARWKNLEVSLSFFPLRVKQSADPYSDVQSQLPLDQTLLYGVFSSDKVNLTSAPNRKAGYPGYFTLGNLSSDNRILINNENLIKIADYPVFDKSESEFDYFCTSEISTDVSPTRSSRRRSNALQEGSSSLQGGHHEELLRNPFSTSIR